MELASLGEILFTVNVKFSVPKPDSDEREEVIEPIVYRPLTPPLIRRMDELRADPEQGNSAAMAALVAAMPKLTDKGAPVPITREVFERIDYRYTDQIERAIAGDFFGLSPSPEAQTGLGGAVMKGAPSVPAPAPETPTPDAA